MNLGIFPLGCKASTDTKQKHFASTLPYVDAPEFTVRPTNLLQ